MNSRELAELTLSCPPKHKISDYVHHVNDGDKGINFVLGYLYFAKGPVTFGDIAKEAPFSTARLAALLNKMEERGLAIRTDSRDDARKTYVYLTESGKNLHNENREKIVNGLARAIDIMGEDDFKELQRLVSKWFSAMDQVVEELDK